MKKMKCLYDINKNRFICLFLIIFLLFTQTAYLFDSRGAFNYYDLKTIEKEKYLDLGVRGFQQTTDYTCGACALMSVLLYYDLIKLSDCNSTTELKLAKQLGTNERGTTPEQLIKWFKEHDIDVKYGINGDLKLLEQSIHDGYPVMVEWIDWGGHWVILTGLYREEMKGNYTAKDTYFFADSAIQWYANDNPLGISSFSVGRFDSMWFDAYLFKKGDLIKGIYIIPMPRKDLVLKF